MRKYFKFIGVLSLICWIIGLIIYIMALGKLLDNAQAIEKILYISVLIVIIVIGPAVGLLFIWVADAVVNPIDKHPYDIKVKEDTEKPIYHDVKEINQEDNVIADIEMYERTKKKTRSK